MSENLNKKDSMYGYTPEQFKKFTSYSWSVLLLFAFLYCFLYCGRLNMSTAIPMMESEMGWSKEQMGIFAATLLWTYGFGHLINGRLGEVFGIKKVMVLGVILSAAANVFISFQSSLIIICVVWGLNGYFQAMLWSPGMALISNWWPGAKRGFATGFSNASSSLGTAAAFLAAAFATMIDPDIGWRGAFRYPIILMLIAMVIFAIFCKEKPSKVGLPEYKEDAARAQHEDELTKVVAEKGKLYPYIHLFKNWRFDCWCLIVAGSNIARYGLLTWIPSYFAEVKGMEVKAGAFASIWLPLGMALGTFLVPWLTDRYCPTNRLPAVIICSLVAAGTVFLFPSIESNATAAVLLFVAGFFIYAINGLVWAYATDIGGRVFSGTATGILDCAAYIGAGTQAVIFGKLLMGGNWSVLFVGVTGICLFVTVMGVVAGLGLKKKIA